MKPSDSMSSQKFNLRKQLKIIAITFNVIWTLLFVGVYFWVVNAEKAEILKLAQKQARASHDKDVMYREWIASKGGVYASIDKNTPPNPFLKYIPERDIITPSGKKLTLVNPAYMTRQVHELSEKKYGVKGHITSLNPIRPENKPDEWEIEALKTFENGEESLTGISQIDGKPYLRYMERFIVDDSCLKCHAHQGYKIGDIRGGISTSVPLLEYYEISSHRLKFYSPTLFFIWFAGILLFNCGSFVLRKNIKFNEKTERALHESRNQLMESQDIAKLGSYSLDITSGLWTSSEILDSVFGIDEKFERSIEGWASLIHPDDRQMMVNHFTKEVVAQGVKFDKQYRIIRNNDQAELWVHGMGRLDFDKEGHPIKMHGTIQDITPQKKAELELAKRQAQFSAIFNSITDAIVFTDLDRRILMINPAFTSTLGYDLEEVKGKETKFFYANPDDFQQKGKERFRKRATIDNPVYEVDYRRKDGAVFTGETLGIHVKDSTQNSIGYLGIIRDITQRKRNEEEKAELEKQLRQAYKMEAIGTMAGGIAHDFNNILAIILGNADMAKDDIPTGNNARYNIDQVIKASNRAKDLVKQILTFSRQSEQQLSPIQPCPIIKESLKLLRSTIPTTISIVQNVCNDSCNIIADATQIHQLLMNLFSNAVHAMEEKGTLEVTVDLVDLDAQYIEHRSGLNPGQHLKIKVKDTGKGIDKESQERIFDPFYTTKEIDEGTGMGLSIVLGIVKNHKGFIEVDSELGEGTTFTIYFPVVEEVGVQETSNPIEDNPKGDEKILFVDDEVMLADMGQKILERQGYQVTATTSSNHALEIFQSDPDAFDLVITDQSMPNISGYELSEELLKIRHDIPIILCTGFSKKISEKTAKKIGIKAFCIKPLDRKSLAAVVRNVLDEK